MKKAIEIKGKRMFTAETQSTQNKTFSLLNLIYKYNRDRVLLQLYIVFQIIRK